MTDASTEQDIPETETVDIQGRDVVIKPLNDAQLALMGREVRLMSKDTTPRERKLDAVSTMFTILESVVVSAEDKEYMNDLIIAGKLDLKALTSFVTVFTGEDAQKPKVRRGRAPAKR